MLDTAPQKRSFPITQPQYEPVVGGFGPGRRVHTFRQSSLKTLDLCLERGRLEMSGLMARNDTDSSAQGTAVHAAIEASIQSELSGQGWLTVEDMTYIAVDEFEELSAAEGFLWIKTKRPSTVHTRIERMLTTWDLKVRPRLVPVATELTWGPFTIYEDHERIIQLTGCIDYIDALTGGGDWKTASRSWEAWEHKRWDQQASIYTWAMSEMLIVHGEREGIWPFTFYVMNSDGSYQEIVVQRHAGDWAWIKERCVAVAQLIEAELPVWPKNDNHALCSPTWCPAWDQCKGQHYAPGWPETSVAHDDTAGLIEAVQPSEEDMNG